MTKATQESRLDNATLAVIQCPDHSPGMKDLFIPQPVDGAVS